MHVQGPESHLNTVRTCMARATGALGTDSVHDGDFGTEIKAELLDGVASRSR